MMLAKLIQTLLMIFVAHICTCLGYVLLYETEDSAASEVYDCIHYTEYGQTIPYCRRSGFATLITDWSYTACQNDGRQWYYYELINASIKPSEVLRWSSSVASADTYAAIYYDRSERCSGCFVCQCTKFGTFGQFCQYQLSHYAVSFQQAIEAQFEQKHIYPFGIQEHGRIVCYTTLECNYGLLCLDWRDVCDGQQQCMYGLDEENCDKLEFNECDQDEYRCDNGMCVAEDYWLDGLFNPYKPGEPSDYIQIDCMDRSDEKFRVNSQIYCAYYSSNMECDENLAYDHNWSCGDGQYISWQDRMAFQTTFPDRQVCHNMRNLYYMCELWRPSPSSWPYAELWTAENGMCQYRGFDDYAMGMHENMSDTDRCTYIVRCALSAGAELDCPCTGEDCSQLLTTFCDDQMLVQYPREGALLAPHIFMFYNWTQRRNWIDPTPDEWWLDGTVRCRGFEASSAHRFRIEYETLTIRTHQFDYLPCVISNGLITRNYTSSHKFHEHCWANESWTFSNQSYAFYDVCTLKGRECIAQYRINDKIQDCSSGQDESSSTIGNDLCSNLRKQRFRCSDEQPSCINALHLGTGIAFCHNRFDENFYGTGISTGKVLCLYREDPNCQFVKQYIGNSWMINSTSGINRGASSNGTGRRLQFRDHCDSYWALPQHLDESSVACQNWICLEDEYQCRTGQCIDLNWVCDGEWDCSDASDEEGIVLAQPWSEHNNKLNATLDERRDECKTRYSRQPFSALCNDTAHLFPCYLPNMTNAVDILKPNQRPCISLKQIGDGKEDCYMGFDEKNMRSDQLGNMLGFQLACGNNSYVPFIHACLKEFSCMDPILCSYKSQNKSFCSENKDVVCLNGTCVPNARCNGVFDCLPYGEDEYWCTSSSLPIYRLGKEATSLERVVKWFLFPKPQLTNVTSKLLPTHFEKTRADTFYWQSFTCNRGVYVAAVGDIHNCFCQPAYYGSHCQYFNDRITIVARIDRETLPKRLTDSVLTIQTNLLFDGEVIDHHEFHSDPVFDYMEKQRFYLSYSRSTKMLKHKRARYRNRSDIVTNHPYSIHFDVYLLPSNTSTAEELGSWRYPVYFDFLPSHRLAPVLKFPSWWNSLDPCQGMTCPLNSVCRPIFNSKKNKSIITSFYCSCQNGFYGNNCQQYQIVCERYCSSHSLCKPDKRGQLSNTLNPFCVCPLGRFGARCNLRHDECDSNPCLNNGTCHHTYDPSGERRFVCLCSQLFRGDLCQSEKMSVRVDIVNMTVTEPVAVVAQLYDVHKHSLELQFVHQQVYKGLPSTIRYNHDQANQPMLGVLKIYDRSPSPALYFIMYIQHGVSKIDVKSSPVRCPPVSTLLFRDNTVDLAEIPDSFRYHYLCRNNSRLFCFYDAEFLCICQENRYRADCLGHTTRVGLEHCDLCLSSGKCVKGSPNDPDDFICLCPHCYEGLRCEYSLQAFGITLDYLLGPDSTGIQSMYIVFALILFLVGFVNNLCALLTFTRPKPRKTGVGYYLLFVAILNIAALFVLLVEFAHVRLGSAGLTNDASCKAVNYLLSVFSRASSWLTTWITISRLAITLFPTKITLKNTRKAIVFSIFTVVILCALHGHQLLTYKTMKNLDSSAFRCVTDFTNQALAAYTRVSTLSHFVVPFMVQLISISFLIVLMARSRAKTTGSKLPFRQELEKQFRAQKELYVTPVIIVLSALPEGILSLSLACTSLSDWKRHAILIVYLLSYTPQVLGFILYVLPSTEYKKEFSKTILAKRLFCWMFYKPVNGQSSSTKKMKTNATMDTQTWNK